jgi:hypothetical protein
MTAWRTAMLALLLAALPAQAALLPRLVGHWLGSYRGEPIELRMNADGSGSYQGEAIRWDVRYGQLHIDRAELSEIYAMKVDAETLIIAGGERATLLVLVRVPDEDAADSASND